ncbi:MAG: putative rane protein insertion efficiency factor [Planctomycetota bacterium]|jgi:putative membrane protein insertion efficiency factor
MATDADAVDEPVEMAAGRALDGSGLASPTMEEPEQGERPGAVSNGAGHSAADDARWRRVVRWLTGTGPAAALVFAVRGYQVLLGPFLGGHCRFQPTCSHYFIQAVQKHGPWRGAWKGTLRVLRCHPFRPGGYDPP